jgi:hypothetical protein
MVRSLPRWALRLALQSLPRWALRLALRSLPRWALRSLLRSLPRPDRRAAAVDLASMAGWDQQFPRTEQDRARGQCIAGVPGRRDGSIFAA